MDVRDARTFNRTADVPFTVSQVNVGYRASSGRGIRHHMKLKFNGGMDPSTAQSSGEKDRNLGLETGIGEGLAEYARSDVVAND